MPIGKLQVHLVSAKGLHDTDFFTMLHQVLCLNLLSIRIFVLQIHNPLAEGVLTGQGSSPEWNETFEFTVTSDEEPKLVIKIKDSDVGSDDDIVGEAKIPLEPVFLAGSVPPTSYNVIINDEFCVEIKVGLEFIPEEKHEHGHRHRHGHGHHEEERNFGGWKESSY
ncbi:hypothetical protein E3N88_26956 [Mikania micrantha]|uniref:C2 domain-containing protein n=1 Tax=Mikania micrantha TaxID=192012 RepID=A0A5N6MY69_9ASTR|nr:hypothetical protein E3N88_26956 [Mikania micrantha]